MFGFSTYSYAPEVRYEIGWLYTSLLSLILLINVAVMITEIVLGVKLFLKKRKYKKWHDKKKKTIKHKESDSEDHPDMIFES